MTPGKHLLDPLKDWLLSLHGEQPWLMACALFAFISALCVLLVIAGRLGRRYPVAVPAKPVKYAEWEMYS